MKPELKKNISMIGAPLDLGASLRGVSLGPDAIRYAGIKERLERIGYDVIDEGNVSVKKEEAFTVPGSNLKNMNVIVEANKELCEKVDTALKKGNFPLVLGGDHSIAIGTIKGVLHNIKNLGVIWFDAHGDINTDKTSPTGNIHGMPVASLLGYGVKDLKEIGGEEYKLNKKNFVFIGSRDLDAPERETMKELGMHVFTMHEVDKMGIVAVMEEAIRIASNGTDGIHVSFDMDVLDPEVAPGTGTKVKGGMGYREAHLSLELIAKTEKLVSAEFVEINPLLDHENMTGEAVVSLAGSLLGEWLI
ncbi:MAG: arginase [Fusobacterium gastrosuis]|uniref:arginase n=1 Tax=Fusobacterium gastrosuis TaxID=1755100 RepID=UPI002A922475|nr:arginase [Fusobacteriaceae bacterium]MDY5795556.1 arginase [Fusobacterium gastrosuis]